MIDETKESVKAWFLILVLLAGIATIFICWGLALDDNTKAIVAIIFVFIVTFNYCVSVLTIVLIERLPLNKEGSAVKVELGK